MRQMLQGFINQILSAQADTVCGAEYGVVSTERVDLTPIRQKANTLTRTPLHIDTTVTSQHFRVYAQLTFS
ncbi:hypothetical protein ABRP64_11035, partial [Corynebacterium sp. KPL4015]